MAAGILLALATPAPAATGGPVARIAVPAKHPHGLKAHAAQRHARAAAACEGADAAPSAGDVDAVRDVTLCLINRERTQRGLRRLRANADLQDAAQGHSSDMTARRYFEHDSPGGATMVDRIKRAGYVRARAAWTVGENIAWGTGDLATPRRIVASWMASPPHRANILRGSFKEIGIGVSLRAPVDVGGDLPGATYTTDFGATG
jgi:uncharacterized protein YkwD